MYVRTYFYKQHRLKYNIYITHTYIAVTINGLPRYDHLRIFENLRRVCGGEEQDLRVRPQQLLDVESLLPHGLPLHHLVCFVQHEYAHIAHSEVALLSPSPHSSWHTEIPYGNNVRHTVRPSSWLYILTACSK